LHLILESKINKKYLTIAIIYFLTNSLNRIYSQSLWSSYLQNDIRKSEIFFQMNNKLYLGETNSFGEYDTYSDTLISKASVSINKQFVDYSFSISNSGYVIMNQSLYVYDPLVNKWEMLIQNVPVKSGGNVQVLNGKAYFFSSEILPYCVKYSDEVWEFNPLNGVFLRKNNIPIKIVGFSGFLTMNCYWTLINSIVFKGRIFILSNYMDNENPGSVFTEYFPLSDKFEIISRLPPSKNSYSATLFQNSDKLYAYFYDGLNGDINLYQFEELNNTWINVNEENDFFKVFYANGYRYPDALLLNMKYYFDNDIDKKKSVKPAQTILINGRNYSNTKLFNPNSNVYIDFDEIQYVNSKCINKNENVKVKFKLNSFNIDLSTQLFVQISDSTGKFKDGLNFIPISIDSIVKKRRIDWGDKSLNQFNNYLKSIYTSSLTIDSKFLLQKFKIRIMTKIPGTFSSSKSISSLGIYFNPEMPILKSFDNENNRYDIIPIDTICYGSIKKFVNLYFNGQDIWEREGRYYENNTDCIQFGSTPICFDKGGNTNTLRVTEDGTYRVKRSVNGCSAYSNQFIIKTLQAPSSPIGDLQFYGKSILNNLKDSARIVSTSASNIEFIWSYNNAVIKRNDEAFVIAKIPGNYFATAKFKNTGSYVCGRKQMLNLSCSSCLPLNFKYNFPIDAIVGDEIWSIPNIITTPNTIYSISPALPIGVVINSNNGAISGKSSEILTEKIFTVNAKNEYGIVSTNISIKISRFNHIPRILNEKIIISNFIKKGEILKLSIVDDDNDPMSFELLNQLNNFNILPNGDLILLNDGIDSNLLEYIDLKINDGYSLITKRIQLIFCESLKELNFNITTNKIFNSNTNITSSMKVYGSNVKINAKNNVFLGPGLIIEKGSIFEVNPGIGCPK